MGQDGREQIEADRVVLALGNFAPADPRVETGSGDFYGSEKSVTVDKAGSMLNLVRWADESSKPNGQRLPEYSDARKAAIELPPFAEEHDVVLTFEYPGWSDSSETTLCAHWPGPAGTRR